MYQLKHIAKYYFFLYIMTVILSIIIILLICYIISVSGKTKQTNYSCTGYNLNSLDSRIENLLNDIDTQKNKVVEYHESDNLTDSVADIHSIDDPMMYNTDILSDTSTDYLISNRMKYMGMQTHAADTIRTKLNKNSMLPYYKNELKETEERVWWENDL